ncbi:AAA family ATPase [Patescibacteria group bacterium]
MIIGITGTNASGKDTAAQFFTDKGFENFSVSDVLRKEARKRNIPVTRKNLQDLGKEIREKSGAGYLAQETLKNIKGNAVVTSFRHPIEVETFKKNKGFIFLNIDAPVEIRFKRAQSRNRGEQDATTLEKFKKQEAREFAKKGSGQQLGVCMEMADYKIENDETKEEFYKKLEKLFNKIQNEKK